MGMAAANCAEIYLCLLGSPGLLALGQYSPSKLVATELFTIGGYNTVRGYDENIVSGDQGWLVVNELRTPINPLGS